MEPTFYHDDGDRNTMMQKMKSKMTLDFGSVAKTKESKLTNLLSSPDLNLLKLASPELEKMIIQHNGMVTTTPTPTQFLCPKFVTEEQEAYARGFVDALAELHKKQGPPSAVNASSMDASDATSQMLNLSTTTSMPVDVVSSTSAISTSTSQLIPSVGLTSMNTAISKQVSQPQNDRVGGGVVRVKQEDMDTQCVPCIGNTPPLSPINMENQERIKLERKRARNRVAARKCRTRKLERISRLEDRVSDLKSVNTELSDRANDLRSEVCRLKQQIMEHVQSGCPVMLSQNLTL